MCLWMWSHSAGLSSTTLVRVQYTLRDRVDHRRTSARTLTHDYIANQLTHTRRFTLFDERIAQGLSAVTPLAA
jgi:hypothetical protein